MRTVTFALPDRLPAELADLPDEALSRRAFEAFLADGVRQGSLTRGFFRQQLDLDYEAGESLLSRLGVLYDLPDEEWREELAGVREDLGLTTTR